MSQENIDLVVTIAGADQAAQGVQNVGDKSDHAAKQVKELEHAVSQLEGVLAAAGVAFGVAELAALATEYTNLKDKLAQVSESYHEFTEAQHALFDMAQMTRQSLGGVEETFVSLAEATEHLGMTQKELLNITQTISKAATVSQKSMTDVAQAVKMLTVNMETGGDSGRTFLLLMRQFPQLARSIGDDMHRTTGQLRQGLADGSISAKALLTAMSNLSGEGNRLDDKFKQMSVTIPGAFQKMQNAILLYIGKADEAGGISTKVAKAISFIADNASVTLPIIGALSTGLTVLSVALAVCSGVAQGLWAAIRNNPFGLIASGLAIVISLFASFGDKIKFSSDGAVNALSLVVGVIQTLWSVAVQAFSVIYGVVKAVLDMNWNGWTASLAIGAAGMALLELASAGLAAKIAALIAYFIYGAVQAGIFAVALAAGVVAVLGIAAAVLLFTAALLKLSDALGISDHAFEKFVATVDTGTAKIITGVKQMGTDAAKAVTDFGKNAVDSARKWNDAANQIDIGGKKIEGAGNAAANGAKAMGTASVGMQLYWHEVESAQTRSKATLSAMGDDVGAAAIVINKAWNHAANDPDAGMKAYQQRLYETEKAQDDVSNAIIKKSREQTDAIMKDRAAEAQATHSAQQKMGDETAAESRRISAYNTALARSYSDAGYQIDNAMGRTVEQMKAASQAASDYQDKMTEMSRAVHDAAEKLASDKAAADWNPATGSGKPGGSFDISMGAGWNQYNFAKDFAETSIKDLSNKIALQTAQNAINGLKDDVNAKAALDVQQQQLAILQAQYQVEFGGQANFGTGSGTTYYQSQYFTPPSSGQDSYGHIQDRYHRYATGGQFMVGGTGGTDSQMVRFMASPDEEVTVTTPAQRRAGAGVGGGRPINVSMRVVTPDANSFNRSQPQNMAMLASKLSRVQRAFDGR